MRFPSSTIHFAASSKAFDPNPMIILIVYRLIDIPIRKSGIGQIMGA
jgi:hypothetical protein